jgi:hypothetical protein
VGGGQGADGLGAGGAVDVQDSGGQDRDAAGGVANSGVTQLPAGPAHRDLTLTSVDAGAVAEDQAGHRLGRLGVQAGQHMRVAMQRDLDGGVAQPLGDDLGRDAGTLGGSLLL